MDIETLLYRAAGDRICEIRFAADKALTQRLFNMSVARLPPVRLRNEQRGKNTKKIKIKRIMKKSPTAAILPWASL
jgi:hypothetical protein